MLSLVLLYQFCVTVMCLTMNNAGSSVFIGLCDHGTVSYPSPPCSYCIICHSSSSSSVYRQLPLAPLDTALMTYSLSITSLSLSLCALTMGMVATGLPIQKPRLTQELDYFSQGWTLLMRPQNESRPVLPHNRRFPFPTKAPCDPLRHVPRMKRGTCT